MPLPEYMQRSIKAQLRDNKAALFEAIQKIASGDKNYILSYLYEINVPLRAITEGFSIDAQKLIETRGANPVSIVSCVECHAHLPDDNLVGFRQQVRTLRYLAQFPAGALVDRDRLYELMCPSCADEHREQHAEQLRVALLARKARLAEVVRIARRSLKEYFETPEWRAKSSRAKIRAGNRCQVCGRSDVQLETHHNSYERLGEELPVDLVVLCRDCHQIYHERGVLPGAA